MKKQACYLKEVENSKWIVVDNKGNALCEPKSLRIEACSWAINRKLNLKGEL